METETATLQARMNHPVFVVPGALDALQALSKAINETGVSPKLLELISLRASQINGCGVCAVQHPRIARKLGETDDRIFAVAAWRDAPYFTDAERAALALDRGGDEDQRPLRPRARRDLGRGCPPLRRDRARGARPRDRRHQRLEPPQRHDASGGRRGVVTWT